MATLPPDMVCIASKNEKSILLLSLYIPRTVKNLKKIQICFHVWNKKNQILFLKVRI